MSSWWYWATYLVIALIVAGMAIEDISDADDVGKSSIVGITWPVVVIFAGYWYLLAGIVRVRDYITERLEKK